MDLTRGLIGAFGGAARGYAAGKQNEAETGMGNNMMLVKQLQEENLARFRQGLEDTSAIAKEGRDEAIQVDAEKRKLAVTDSGMVDAEGKILSWAEYNGMKEKGDTKGISRAKEVDLAATLDSRDKLLEMRLEHMQAINDARQSASGTGDRTSADALEKSAKLLEPYLSGDLAGQRIPPAILGNINALNRMAGVPPLEEVYTPAKEGEKRFFGSDDPDVPESYTYAPGGIISSQQRPPQEEPQQPAHQTQQPEKPTGLPPGKRVVQNGQEYVVDANGIPQKATKPQDETPKGKPEEPAKPTPQPGTSIFEKNKESLGGIVNKGKNIVKEKHKRSRMETVKARIDQLNRQKQRNDGSWQKFEEQELQEKIAELKNLTGE